MGRGSLGDTQEPIEGLQAKRCREDSQDRLLSGWVVGAVGIAGTRTFEAFGNAMITELLVDRERETTESGGAEQTVERSIAEWTVAQGMPPSPKSSSISLWSDSGSETESATAWVRIARNRWRAFVR